MRDIQKAGEMPWELCTNHWSKETYSSQKRPIQVKRDHMRDIEKCHGRCRGSCAQIKSQKRPIWVKRDVLKWKEITRETYINVRGDAVGGVHNSDELCAHQMRPINIKREMGKQTRRPWIVVELKRDTQIQRDPQKRNVEMKRALEKSRETYWNQKRPNGIKQDLIKSKETLWNQKICASGLFWSGLKVSFSVLTSWNQKMCAYTHKRRP